MVSFKPQGLSKNSIIVLSILSILEFLSSLVALFVIPREVSSGVLLGYSVSRMILIGISLAFSVVFFFLLFSTVRDYQKVASFLKRISTRAKLPLASLAYFITIAGFIVLLTSPVFWGRYEPHFIRLRPLIYASSLTVIQWVTFLWIRSLKLINPSHLVNRLLKLKAFWITFSSVFLIFTGFYLTKFGFVEKTALWNVPGIPITNLQFFMIFSMLLYLLALKTHLKGKASIKMSRGLQRALPFLIFLISALIWGFTPLHSHELSLNPTSPAFQPFPFRDAQVHDIGALSILNGDGIYFRGYTDKPLYMILLALYHFFAGNNYQTIIWIQIVFLSWIPVVAYLIGKKMVESLFGLLVAALIVIQQTNSIILSLNIATINLKLLATEGTTLLGILIIIFLLFRWYQTRELRFSLLLGGAVGSISLIRLNPILFLPAIGLFVLIFSWRSRKAVFSQLLIYTVGFFIVFSPWMLTGVNQSGESWVFVKFRDVFQNRISPTVEQTSLLEANPLNFMREITVNIGSLTQFEFFQNKYVTSSILNLEIPKNKFFDLPDQDIRTRYIFFFEEHFIHNITTSFLALPDSIGFEKLLPLSSRPYWIDSNDWGGNFPPTQLVIIVVNLCLTVVGVLFAWNRHRWGGMIPLLCFLVYDIALSISLTSGGRYIVPINWIIFFYWGLGIYSILQLIFSSSTDKTIHNTSNELINPVKGQVRSLVPSFFILLIPVVLILGANLLLPAIKANQNIKPTIKILEENMVIINPTYSYIKGNLLYPIDVNSGFLFTFLNNGLINSYALDPSEFLVPTSSLGSGITIIVEYNQDSHIQRIFTLEAGKTQFVKE